MNRLRRVLFLIAGAVSAGLALCSSSDFSDFQKILEARAEAGDVVAMRELGLDLYEGLNGHQNPIEGVKWLRQAADLGDGDAQFTLAVAYQEGNGVPKDAVLGYMWMNLAAASGSREAASIREILRKSMTAEQLAEAQRLGREWKPKLATAQELPRAPEKEKLPSNKLQALPVEPPKRQAEPRFDFGAFSGAALPGIVILSGVALGILIRKRQDAARIATGNPPLRYGHEVGALAAIFYLAGVGALVALPKSGSWLIALALGALLHFMKIGSLRKRAEKEAARAGE